VARNQRFICFPAASFDPSLTSITIAVPSIQYSLRSLVATFPRETPLIPAAIDLKAMSNVPSFDVEKISPGLDETFGDEDLCGHESPRLYWRKETLESDLQLLQCGVVKTDVRIEQCDRTGNVLTSNECEGTNLQTRHYLAQILRAAVL